MLMLMHGKERQEENGSTQRESCSESKQLEWLFISNLLLDCCQTSQERNKEQQKTTSGS